MMESESTSGSWDFTDVLTGAGLVVLGFLLAVIWDEWKTLRQRRSRDRALLRAALAETDALLVVVTNDLNLVQHELALIAQNKLLLNPLDPIESRFWDLVKVDPPSAVLKEPDGLTKIQDVQRRTDQVTQLIQSREAFRVSNMALTSFQSQIKEYDELLEKFLKELIDALNDLSPLVQRVSSRS